MACVLASNPTETMQFFCWAFLGGLSLSFVKNKKVTLPLHMNYPSKLIEASVEEIAQLPGIGKRTAMRLTLHLLKRSPEATHTLAKALHALVDETQYCRTCHAISEQEICDICQHPLRDKKTICVVEDIRDVMAIENTAEYKGVYHVLGGRISPMEGIGPSDLNLENLIKRAQEADEFIFALSPTLEGDTTIFYLYKLLKGSQVKLTTLAKGIGIGDELEYTDEVTLARSLKNRILYEDSLAQT